VLVAAPAYLREHGVPRQPAELAAHQGLLTAVDATRWTLSQDKADTVQTVEPQPRLVADESVALLHAATAGLGIVCLPETICQHHVARGELVRVLPRWTAGSVTTTALVPHRRSLLPSVRAVLDFLAVQLG
jgi:DNA-binding transcriptional LysR family regulator